MGTPEAKTLGEAIESIIRGIERQRAVAKALLSKLGTQADEPAALISTSVIHTELKGIKYDEFNENDEAAVQKAVDRILSSVASKTAEMASNK